MLRYLAGLDTRRLVLWCAFLWYVVIAARHGDLPAQRWMSAAAIALIVGSILTVNAIPATGRMRSLERWTVFRFFVIPFCVSSLSAIAARNDFALIFPQELWDNVVAVGAGAGFCVITGTARMLARGTT